MVSKTVITPIFTRVNRYTVDAAIDETFPCQVRFRNHLVQETSMQNELQLWYNFHHID